MNHYQETHLLKQEVKRLKGVIASLNDSRMREIQKLKEEIKIRVNAVAGKQMDCREFWMFSVCWSCRQFIVPRKKRKFNPCA